MLKTSNMVYKTLVIGVIVLFIVVGIQPVIATIQTEDRDLDYINITSTFTGLRRKHTVEITQQELEELDAFFETIYEKLNSTESDEETSQIFNEAINELGRYDLLGGLSVEQIQNRFSFYKKINRYIDSRLNSGKENANCLVIGRVSQTCFFRPLVLAFLALFPFTFFLQFFILSLSIKLGFPLFPIRFYDSIGISWYYERFLEWYEHRANGWIFKNDSNGSQMWRGELKGILDKVYLANIGIEYYYIGVEGFFGIKTIIPRYKTIFLGYANNVGIEYW